MEDENGLEKLVLKLDAEIFDLDKFWKENFVAKLLKYIANWIEGKFGDEIGRWNFQFD